MFRRAGILVFAVFAGIAGVVWWAGTLLALGTVYHVYFDRRDLPDLGPFVRFEFPTLGRIYDRRGHALIELGERRQITQYADIPPILRDAILAAEDKRFFSHNGVDYRSVPRVMSKLRLASAGTPAAAGEPEGTSGRSMFAQGGSTITQQLARGLFLQHLTSQENNDRPRDLSRLTRALSSVVGARSVSMMLRKREEIRLSFWIEREMRARFGSKRRAKEEIFARYASFVYMGRGQYGLAQAAEYYFGRRLGTFDSDDADQAALLAGIMKAPRDYAPSAADPTLILRRRNQILALMAAQGLLSPDAKAAAVARPLPSAVLRPSPSFQSSAVVEHVLDGLGSAPAGVSRADLFQGRIQVYATVDLRVQRIATDALERGLARYERRHPGAQGLVQGSVVVLENRDGSILAETGGRLVYRGRATSYSDFNRVRESRRQPGSTMKAIVYLAAFRQGDFTLETLVPDAPISVANGGAGARKFIANYDGRFAGLIPVRQALAESRNAVAVWIAREVGIDAVLRAARSIGVLSPLARYPTTALGASEMTLLELATAYRTIASGVLAPPYVIRRIVRDSGEIVTERVPEVPPIDVVDPALALIQEGLRGVVRMPTGTAHRLSAGAFPIAVMGKTGTTNEFRDALFVGSTYGVNGITVAVRIGFDDNRSLGAGETGSRVALPVFEELMREVYRDRLVGPAPAFPHRMEDRITRYLRDAETMAQNVR